MALASQVEQVLMVCPDVPREDIERDLTVTGNAQETINRIFEGLFLVGCPSPLPELDGTPASLDGCPTTAVPRINETDEIERRYESGALIGDADDNHTLYSEEDGSSLEALTSNHCGSNKSGGLHSDDDSDHEELPDILSNNHQPLLRKPDSNGFYKGTPLSSLRETSSSEHCSVSTNVGFHSSQASTSKHILTDDGHGSLSEGVSHEPDSADDCIDLTLSPQKSIADPPYIDGEFIPPVAGLRRESPILLSSENCDILNSSGISIPSSHVISDDSVTNELISDQGWPTSKRDTPDRSRSSSSDSRKSDFLDDPVFEEGATGRLDHQDEVSPESKSMDVDDDAVGRCSPMSISSSDDEEEDITLSLLHRIRSKQMSNPPALGMHQSREQTHRLGNSESGVGTSRSHHRSDKLPSKDAVDLSNDRKKRGTGVCKIRVPKSYHDISDDEDEEASSLRTDCSSCPSIGADFSEVPGRASGLEDVRVMPQSYQGSSHGSLPSESSCDSMPTKKKPRRSPEEIAASKQQALERRVKKDQEKQEKLRQQQERKQLKHREAQVQKALREAHKAHRPEECMKYVTVVINPTLLEDSGGAVLLAKLQELDCKTAVESQPIPGCITWRRQVMEHNLGDDLQLNTLHQMIEECQALVHLPVASFVDLVHTFKQEQQGAYCTGQESLREHASNIQQILQGKAITFIIQGMEKYFRLKKNSKQRNFRSAVLGSEPSTAAVKKQRKKRPIEDITTVVTRVDMEEALVDLQLHTGCNVRLFETPAEVADAVAMFTKSVAETPFKRERDKATFSFHVDTEWAGGVKVSKEGRGLLRVWRQQLQQFRNVSPEVASCIVAAYPSPRLLLQAYAKCDTVQEARKLLQDIVIRRGEGVLATSRRVGPELSKRVHTLMTSTEPNLAL